MKKLVAATLFLAIMLCGSAVLAGPRGWGQGMGPAYGGAGYGAPSLNLTEDQSAKLQSLRENYFKEIAPLQSRMVAMRSELRLLWNAAEPDRGKITAKQKEVSGLQSRLDEMATAYRLDCRGVLTPEQQSQMAAAGPAMRRGSGPGWGHHGRGW